MIKILKQIQKENRKVIIIANNPEAKSYADAIDIMYPSYLYDYDLECNSYKEYNVEKHCYEINVNTVLENEIAPRIPLTLDRVLIAISSINYTELFIEPLSYIIEDNKLSFEFNNSWTEWDLTKTTLEEQTEETQRAIYELLNH